MTVAEEAPDESELAAALDGWAAAFDREMEQNGDFATSVAAMTEHGCFDVRAVVERWILANPTGSVTMPAQVQIAVEEPLPLRLVAEEPPAPPAPRAAVAPQEPAPDEEPPLSRRRAAATPDIAYFHSLLQGGIERAQIEEAFPDFVSVIDEAVAQHEAEAPILSDVPRGPTRDDLNDEMRGVRQDLQASGKPGRRRWRDRN